MYGFNTAGVGRRRFLSAGVLGLFGLLLGLGCHGKVEEPLHPVKGTILLNGQPLTQGDIWFVPDDAKGAKHFEFSLSKINPDGTYELKTFQNLGAKAGWYKVAVFSTRNPRPGSNENPWTWVGDWIVDEKYSKHETSPLVAEVVADPQPGRYDFHVTAPVPTN